MNGLDPIPHLKVPKQVRAYLALFELTDKYPFRSPRQ